MITIKGAKKIINVTLKDLGLEEDLFYDQYDTEDIMELLRGFREFLDDYESALLQKIDSCQRLIHKTDEATCWAIDNYILIEKAKLEEKAVGAVQEEKKPKVAAKSPKAEKTTKEKPKKVETSKARPAKKKEKKNDN